MEPIKLLADGNLTLVSQPRHPAFSDQFQGVYQKIGAQTGAGQHYDSDKDGVNFGFVNVQVG